MKQLAQHAIALLLIAAVFSDAGAAENPPEITHELLRCASCHDWDGKASSIPVNGRIAGQNYQYLVYMLKQYRTGGRLEGLNGGIMTNAVRHLSDGEIESIARFYSALP